MGRTPCCNEQGLKKGAWTADEDQKLIAYIQKHGEGGWRALPQKAGLQRCGKSCRLRWANYLRPDIKRGEFSAEEDEAIIQLHAIKGNKWSAIASRLPGRTDNEIKNYWNTHLKKRLVQKGINPVTHKSISTVINPPENNSDNIVGNTSEKISPSQSSSSRSTSVSAQLLNKVANKLSLTVNHAALSKIIAGGGVSSGNINDIESPTFSLSSSDSQSKISGSSTSTSRLLNKMATSRTMLKEILSKTEGSQSHESAAAFDGFDVEMGSNCSAEYPISKSTSSVSNNDSMAPLYSIGHDGGALDFGCYNMESPMSKINFLQDKSALYPDDHQPFMFAEFLEKCEGEINYDDELITNMAFDSVEGLSPSNCDQNIVSGGSGNAYVNGGANDPGGSTLEETINSWTDDLDFENFGLLDYGLLLDTPMF